MNFDTDDRAVFTIHKLIFKCTLAKKKKKRKKTILLLAFYKCSCKFINMLPIVFCNIRLS